MESKERRNAVARTILLWLYEEGDSFPLVEDFLTQPSADVGDERVGNDELVRTVRWLHDRELVGGLEIDEVPYPVKLTLTTTGRLVVVEQDGWVEPEVSTPDGTSKPTVTAIARAFLLWLYDNNSQQPVPQKFLGDSRSEIAGYQVDEGEMIEAVQLLTAKAFVTGPTSWQSDGIPLRIRLTDAGRVCVVDHDGDVTPRATWNDLERGGGTTIDKSIATTGHGNTVVGHSENVNVAPDPSRTPDFIVERALVGVESGHAIEVTMTGGPQQLQVGIGAAVLDPQEGMTAKVANGEAHRMVRDFKRRIVVTLDPPVRDSDVVVEVIATCQDVDPPNERWTLRRALTITRGPRIY